MNQDKYFYEQSIREEQQSYEAEARKIVESGRDYSGWQRYMADDCKAFEGCTSPICPLDIRLSMKEIEDAEFACKVQNRKPSKSGNALTAFVKKYCACYCDTENLCIGEHRTGTCLIMQGMPCGYFKKAVFPICDPNYKFATEPEKYDKLSKLYIAIEQKVDGSASKNIRICPGINGKSCKVPLLPRRRLCDKCRDRKRRDDYRKHRRK